MNESLLYWGNNYIYQGTRMFQYTTIFSVIAIYLTLLTPQFVDAKALTRAEESNNFFKPKLQHASNFFEGVNIKKYWVSEKLDGVRGYWNGQQLFTRSGKLLNPPQWFTKNWPETAMDGELWSARGEFEQISACIRTTTSDGQCWRKLKLMIFDLPHERVNFTKRITLMQQAVANTHSPYLKAIKHEKLNNTKNLYTLLDNVVNNNGEGVMLHLSTAYYQSGRSKNILKLKKHQDAEAKVIAHLPGKGKYKGLLGAIKVETPEGIIFKIGSGFSDKERKNPPQIGSLITYKYIGKTQRGVPRFASFLRVKKQH